MGVGSINAGRVGVRMCIVMGVCMCWPQCVSRQACEDVASYESLWVHSQLVGLTCLKLSLGGAETKPKNGFEI